MSPRYHRSRSPKMDSTFNFQGVYGDDLPSPHPAPLVIRKVPSRAQSIASRHTRQSSSRSRPTTSSRSQGQVSPPLTPRTSREALSSNAIPQMIFHHYLRAFHHFHPTFTVTSSGDDESSIMVPINQGDVVLVHSVHPNGWADGTLLISGRRGWLPTNYCEPYEPSLMQILLNSLTNVWDLVRGGGDGELTAFTRQDYVRRMIAGVRFLLVSYFPQCFYPCALRNSLPGEDTLSYKRVHSDPIASASPPSAEGYACRSLFNGEDSKEATGLSGDQRGFIGYYFRVVG